MSFPSMISNEPPPLDTDDEDEEFEDEFRANGLHLDISTEPSPMSSPRKPPLGSSKSHLDSPVRITADQIDDLTSPLVNGEVLSKSPQCGEEVGNNKSNNYDHNLDNPVDDYMNIINSISQPDVPNRETLEAGITQSIISSTEWSSNNNSCEENDTKTITNECELDDQMLIGHNEDHYNSDTNPVVAENSSNESQQFHLVFEEENNSQVKIETENEEIIHVSSEKIQNENEEINFSSEVFSFSADFSDNGTNLDAELTSVGVVSVDDGLNDFGSLDNEHEVDDFEDDFGDFDSAPIFSSQCIINSKSETSSPDLFPPIVSTVSDFVTMVEDDDFFAKKPPETEFSNEDFGDFGDFTTTTEKISSSHNLNTTLSFPNETFEQVAQFPSSFSDPDDDFGDFAASDLKESFVSTPVAQSIPPETKFTLLRKESVQIEGRFDALIKSVFSSTFEESDSIPSIGSMNFILEPIDKELGVCASNKTWSHVQDFEDSHCLIHKWPRSKVHQLLLRSLHIDSSTIIYSTKFGTIEVPKFASSLVDTPLQPQQFAGSTPFDFVQPSTSSRSQSSEYEAEDPLDTEIDMVQPAPKSELSRETVKILEQLPDLSYMLAKTLVFPRNPKY